MAYTADDTLSQDGAFQGRIRCAMVKAGLAICTEARTVNNEKDSKRNSLAKSVLNDPDSYMKRFTNACIQASALTSASTDAQLDAAVASSWNGIAGVTSQDI